MLFVHCLLHIWTVAVDSCSTTSIDPSCAQIHLICYLAPETMRIMTSPSCFFWSISKYKPNPNSVIVFDSEQYLFDTKDQNASKIVLSQLHYLTSTSHQKLSFTVEPSPLNCPRSTLRVILYTVCHGFIRLILTK